MNPQAVSEMVGQQVQQRLEHLKQSLMEGLTKQLQDVRLGRPPPRSAEGDAPMGQGPLAHEEEVSDNTSLDGPDWSMYLTGAKVHPSTDAGSALSNLFGKTPALTLIQHRKGKICPYEGVPSTPPARHQHYWDRQWAAVQQK
mmetsp:Transcript_50247/g.89692  ORF Transcript_50247/g.89692 Transcript_50247/m.89692 type:complete len:142 (-) Transcript_50247:1-426(-)